MIDFGLLPPLMNLVRDRNPLLEVSKLHAFTTDVRIAVQLLLLSRTLFSPDREWFFAGSFHRMVLKFFFIALFIMAMLMPCGECSQPP